jgi:hypothetical protein
VRTVLGREFASCWLKIGRAEVHAATLESEIGEWSNRNPLSGTIRRNADGSRHSIFIKFDISADFDRWSLIAADCVHNLRAALDQFFYAVAVHQTGGDPPGTDGELRKLQFPICDTPGGFSRERGKTNLVNPTAWAVLESMQPYHRHHPKLPPLLGILRDFDNFDKHRLLNVAASWPKENGFTNLKCPCPAGTHRVDDWCEPGILVDGAEVATLTVDPPCLNMKFDHSMSTMVVISHSAGPSGAPRTGLVFLMKLLCDEVRSVIEHVGKAV